MRSIGAFVSRCCEPVSSRTTSKLFAIACAALWSLAAGAQSGTAAPFMWRWAFPDWPPVGQPSEYRSDPVSVCIAGSAYILGGPATFHHLEPSPRHLPPFWLVQGQQCLATRSSSPNPFWIADLVGQPVCPNAQGHLVWSPEGICALPADTPNPDKHCGPSSPSTCNPIALATGHKFLVEDDYRGQGAFPLVFTRYYSSLAPKGSMPGVVGMFAANLNGGTLGWTSNMLNLHWRGTFDRQIHLNQSFGYEPRAFATRADGKIRAFRKVNGAWTPDPDVLDKLVQLSSAGVATGWQYTAADDETVETYTKEGRLVQLTTRAGLTQTLTYHTEGSGTGKLAQVADSFGRSLRFAYDAFGRLASVTLPDDLQVSYAYDGAGNLAQVSYPDGALRKFHYNEPDLTSGAQLPTALTGITDENGGRYSRYGYAPNGRAILSEHAGGADRTSVSYAGTSSSVTDALGQTRTYKFAVVNGVGLNTAITGSECPECGPAAQTYDARGFRASSTDWNGNRTNFVHDVRGLETQRVEGLTSSGATTSVARTITTEWHPQYRLPTRSAEPSRLTTFTYGEASDANPGNRGSLLAKTVQATSDANGSHGLSATVIGLPRIWTYTYNAAGRVLTVDGPRTDAHDITTYTYYADDATCPGASTIGCRGQVAAVTNAVGHTTSIDEHDAHGQPLRTTDPNGLVTTLTYDARLRLTSRNVGGEITTYRYDNAGQLIGVTLPDGASTAYTYDAAHRLVQIADNAGNSIVYSLDSAGNRIREDVRDASGALARTRTRIFDGLSRLVQDIGAHHQTTTYTYDRQGNVTAVDGPLGGPGDVTVNSYDALNRLIRVTDPGAGQVNYAYDGRDQLVSVSDPRSLRTSYAYDGLNNLTQLASPDTGVTVNTHDAAGNLLTSTDANGQQARYAYDALNRVTRVEYLGPGAAPTARHTFAYDAGTNQKGRLTSIEEPAGTTSYAYDQKGRLLSETRTIHGVAYSTGYAYDAHGRLAAMTYPGGRQLHYGLDVLGRIQSITTIKGETTQPVLSSVTYQPFGGPGHFTFGNGQSYARGYDGDGRIASYTLATQTIAVGYDSGNRIAFLTDLGNPQNSNTYGYDVLDRLTQFAGPTSAQAFGYDGVGNRLSKTVGALTQSYVYAEASNRLSSLIAGGSRTYTHDPAGNLTSDGLNTYAYDARGRMMRAITSATTTDYTINALGQRIRKTGPQGDTVYHYDDRGRLIAESTGAGVILKEYIYLGDIPVAVLQ